MSKKQRHQFIEKLIAEQPISTQEELVERLKENGFNVTQATVSRDIRQLGLRKKENSQGVLCYQVAKKMRGGEYGHLGKMLRMAYRSHKTHHQMMVVYTLPGSAPAIANAIETLYGQQLFTVLSNDNRFLMIAYDDQGMREVWYSLEQLMEE